MDPCTKTDNAEQAAYFQVLASVLMVSVPWKEVAVCLWAYSCEHLCGIMCDTRLTAEEVMHGTDSVWLPAGHRAPKKSSAAVQESQAHQKRHLGRAQSLEASSETCA